jgi:hypothetical protein
MLTFNVDIELKKKFLLAVALVLSPAVAHANNIDIDINAIPKISSEYFSNLEKKPRLLSNINEESGKSGNIKINNDLTVKVINGGVNVPEYALKLVRINDHTIRLEIEN